MTAYVDPPLWHWHDQFWCHLLADSLDELHDFALKIGKTRRAFQDKRLPHYDLTVVQREVAAGLGACEVSSRQIVVVARRLRVARLAFNRGDIRGAVPRCRDGSDV